MTRVFSCLLFAAVLLATARTVWPQANSATFYGTVTDPTGAVVPAAHATLTNQETRAVITKTTTTHGDFAFTFVPAGAYTVRIDAQGFKAYVGTGITLVAGSRSAKLLHSTSARSPIPSPSRPVLRSSIPFPRSSCRTTVSPTPANCLCRTVILADFCVSTPELFPPRGTMERAST